MGTNKKIHLCDSCSFIFATCKSNPTFGCDAGGEKTDDNVVECNVYLKRRGVFWRCSFCGYSDNGINQQFCTGCGRHK